MRRASGPKVLLALAAALALAGVGVAAGSLGSAGGVRRHYPEVQVTVGTRPMGQPLAPGFVGLSVEYTAVLRYAGGDPRAIDPVLIGLIRKLAPGQRPVIRIGGNSTDITSWLVRGERAPRNTRYVLRDRWLETTESLATTLDARMIMGLNLAGARPEVAAAEAHAFERVIGRSHIEALEIGNEPDLYGLFPWYRRVYARPHDYGIGDYIREFSRWRATVPRGVPVAGPALATLDWGVRGLGRFIAAEPGVQLVTLHRYPLRACLTKPTAPGYPTIKTLLSDQASSGLARALAPSVAVAHRHRVAFRLDELNSASCSGKWGVSDTFASALWLLDTLFDLARIGVDGVNVHTFPGSAYEPFAIMHTHRGWEAVVYPDYYGMLMFAQAFPAGARLVRVAARHGPLKAWATAGPGRAVRVVLINKSPHRTYQVQLRLRRGSGSARVERLRAPSLRSIHRVTLGGRTFGSATATGQLPALRNETVASEDGVYSITVPAASAALVSPSS